MLHAMSRQVRCLWIPFAFVVVAPFAVGCDALKKDSADAAVVAPAVGTAAPVTPAETAAAAPGVAPVAPPLGGAVAPPHAAGGKPVGVVDGGKAADGGVAAVDAGGDGGKTAPVPTPTFVIPTAIPGFDAGGFKPPAGFPSTIPTTLPTFPPPPT